MKVKNYNSGTHSNEFFPIVLKVAYLICLLIVLFTSHLEVKAQDEFPINKFGIRGGLNLNSWTNEFPFTELDGSIIYPDDWKATRGFHIGIYSNLRLSPIVALEPGIAYTVKGTGTILNANGVNVEGSVISNYLDMSLHLKLYLSEGFNLILGTQFAYHLNSSFDLLVDGENVVTGEDVSETISEYDFAPVLGLGYEFESGLNINVTGEFGIWTVDSFGNLDTFNRNIRLSMGYNF